MKGGSMTCPIPPKMRKEMSEDPFYSKCCIKHPECSGRIQFHHHFRYAGKRQKEKFGILPVCEWIHEREKNYDIRIQLDEVMKSRMTEEDRKKYPNRKW
jgi:hypothetical protein